MFIEQLLQSWSSTTSLYLQERHGSAHDSNIIAQAVGGLC